MESTPLSDSKISKIKVINTKNKQEIILENLDVNTTIKEIKQIIKKQLALKIPYNRMGISYSFYPEMKKISITSDYHTLKYYNLDMFNPNQNNNNNNNYCITFYIKDLGPQMGYRTVYIIEYLGPLLIILYYFINLYKKKSSKKENIDTCQIFFFMMSTFHYIKRILETIFVHSFSHDTMPLSNLFKNCIYYWGIYGLLCGYFLFNENYKINRCKIIRYFFGMMFFNAEIKNLKCHLILKDMKKKLKGKKGIPPPKEGFELVTCANYWWEFVAWICFSIFSCHWSVILFTCCGFYQMRIWALKKHKTMKEAFGDRYPKERKAFIPFFI